MKQNILSVLGFAILFTISANLANLAYVKQNITPTTSYYVVFGIATLLLFWIVFSGSKKYERLEGAAFVAAFTMSLLVGMKPDFRLTFDWFQLILPVTLYYLLKPEVEIVKNRSVLNIFLGSTLFWAFVAI